MYCKVYGIAVCYALANVQMQIFGYCKSFRTCDEGGIAMARFWEVTPLYVAINFGLAKWPHVVVVFLLLSVDRQRQDFLESGAVIEVEMRVAKQSAKLFPSDIGTCTAKENVFYSLFLVVTAFAEYRSLTPETTSHIRVKSMLHCAPDG
jgi:hypothetical protein